MSSRMFRVEAPNFVAAFVVKAGKVTVAAPILWRLKGKTFSWAQAYCRRLGWTVILMNEGADAAGDVSRPPG